jgi:peptide/nickel transport system permease protein
MGAFILRRLALGLLAMFVALSGSFFFFAAKFLPLSETPILHSYWTWLRGLPSGRSLNDGLLGSHLVSIVGSAFGRTMLLLALTLVIVVVIAIPVGCLAAAMRGSFVDYLLRIATYIAWAVPVFVIAILFQQGFGRIAGGWGTGWFPSIGWAGQCPNGQGIDPHNFQCPAAGHGLTHAFQVIYHRNSVVDALDAPYVTVARAKGLPERVVVMRHALRNAFVAFVPAIVSDIGVLFGGALVVDFIFQLGGLGQLFIGLLALDADGNTPVDTYELQLMLLFAACVMLTASMIGEILLALFDPRTRLD